jgi:hypothetical protein
MVGNPESRLDSAWLEDFKKKYKIQSDFDESDGIHVDLNTTSFSETPNSYTPVSSPPNELTPPPTAIDPRQMTRRNKSVSDIHSTRSTSMQPPPMPPLPRSENTSPVSLGPPTQDDARQALDLVRRYFWNQPTGFLEPDEYAVVGKLMSKLSYSISEGTAVLPGPKRRKVGCVKGPTCSTGFDGGYSACGGVATELVSPVNVC